MPTSRFQAHISGRVQGVGFRNFAQAWANRLGISGYARNEENGVVEVVAEGPRNELLQFLHQLHIGPHHAQVEDVAVKWEEPTAEFRSFNIRF